MILPGDPLASLTYGQIHVLELGVAIGLLAATLYRSDHYASYTILGLSVGLIVMQRVLESAPNVTATTIRIASMPFMFLVPMFVTFGLGLSIGHVVRSWSTPNEPTDLNEHPVEPVPESRAD